MISLQHKLSPGMLNYTETKTQKYFNSTQKTEQSFLILPQIYLTVPLRNMSA